MGRGSQGKPQKKGKIETWAPRMSSQREAAAANAAGRRGILGIYTIAHMGGIQICGPLISTVTRGRIIVGIQEGTMLFQPYCIEAGVGSPLPHTNPSI